MDLPTSVKRTLYKKKKQNEKLDQLLPANYHYNPVTVMLQSSDRVEILSRDENKIVHVQKLILSSNNRQKSVLITNYFDKFLKHVSNFQWKV